MRFAFVFVAIGTVVVMGVASLACWTYCSPEAETFNNTAWITILLFGTVTLINLQQAILRGLNRVIMAAWPIMLLQPVIMLSLVVASQLVAQETTARDVLVFMTVGNIAAAICMANSIKRTLSNPKNTQQDKPSFAFSEWWRGLLPFFLLGGVALLMQRSDILILGLFRPAEDVGVYAIAAQLGFLAQMPIMVVNSTVEPKIAAAHARKDYSIMRKLYADLSVLTGIMTTAVCAGLWILGPWLLTKLFGPVFTASYSSLMIIALGFWVGALIGPTGSFLSMVGMERKTLHAVGSAVVLNIALNFMLIPFAGLEGAAIATSISMIVSKVLMAIMIWRAFKIKPGPLGYFGLGRSVTQ
jgi:O-antigen/teichoic acid export membrane protein